MKKKLLLLVMTGGLLLAAPLQAQKFGNISRAELSEKKCPIDTSAHACVLYKKRDSYIRFQHLNGFIRVDEYWIRIKIYDREGLDAATAKIPLYKTKNLREYVSNITGYTYNLVDGKVKKTKLDKKKVYREKTSEHIITHKFTMPNVKPGSVVEWKYTVESPFLPRFDDVILQYDVPAKKIDAIVEYPEYLGYKPIVRGYLKVPLKHRTENGSIPEGDITYTKHIWEVHMQNIPALKEEPYAGNVDNYRARLEMELAYIDLPGKPREILSMNWDDVIKEIYDDPDFGGQLGKKLYLKDHLKQFEGLQKDEKIRRIFEWIKKRIHWNHEKSYWTDKGVVKAFYTGEGNAADINLNLINMLNAAGIEAYPVLISTVDHGIPSTPSFFAFNYVVAAVPQGEGYILMDATEKFAVPGLLPERDLNFYGRVVHKDGSSENVNLFPLNYTNVYRNVNVKIDEEGQMEGFFNEKKDNYFALRQRKALDGKKQEDIEKWLQEKYEDLDIADFRILNLNDPYKVLTQSVKFETENGLEQVGDKWYLTPMLQWQLTENPFQSEERHYPIFFQFPRRSITMVRFQLPEGWQVEKLPPPVKYDMPGGKASFEFQTVQNGRMITVKNIISINRPVLPKEDYQALKDFYERIKQTHQNQIVLKSH